MLRFKNGLARRKKNRIAVSTRKKPHPAIALPLVGFEYQRHFTEHLAANWLRLGKEPRRSRARERWCVRPTLHCYGDESHRK